MSDLLHTAAAGAASGSWLALTQGDPAGIGPETIVKAFWSEPELMAGVLVVGQPEVLRRAARVVQQAQGGGQLPLPVVVLTEPADLASCPPRCLPVLDPGTAMPNGLP